MQQDQTPRRHLEGTADDIEAAFYEALQRGDIDALMACWADEDDIFCIHPGGPRVVGADAIRATFEAMFANGSDPGLAGARAQDRVARAARAQRAGARRGADRRRAAPCLGARHQRLPQDGAGLAHGGPPRQPRQRTSETRRSRRCARRSSISDCMQTTSRRGGCRAATCRPSGPRCTARRTRGPVPEYRRERWTTPDGDFVDVDFLDAAGPRRRSRCWCCSTASRARRAATMPRPSPTSRRERGWDYAVPHFRGCSGELNLAPRAYHSGDYEEIGWILARLRARRTPAADGGGRRLAGRQCAAALGRGGGRRGGADRVARWRRSLAAGPGGRRPRHRPRLQPAGLHAHVPAHHEAQGAGQAGAAPGPVRPRDAARGARPVRVRQRLHRAAARLSRHRRLLGARLGQAAPARIRDPGAGAQCRQRSLRAGARACRARARSAAT